MLKLVHSGESLRIKLTACFSKMNDDESSSRESGSMDQLVSLK